MRPPRQRVWGEVRSEIPGWGKFPGRRALKLLFPEEADTGELPVGPRMRFAIQFKFLVFGWLALALGLGGCGTTSSMPAPRSSAYDIRKATAFLRSHAKPKPRPPWECAAYTRRAIEAGGITLQRTRYAKDYGASLERAGFRRLGRKSKVLAGDVVVFAATGEHREGHMAMFDGRQWISDFVQPRFLPSRDYAGASFVIYRYVGR